MTNKRNKPVCGTVSRWGRCRTSCHFLPSPCARLTIFGFASDFSNLTKILRRQCCLPLPCARGSTMPSGNAEDRSGITQSSQYLCCFSAWFDCNFKCRWWHNYFVHCFHFCLFFQIFIPAFPKRFQFDSGSLTKSSLFCQDQDQTSVRIREPNLIGGLHCLLHWVLVLPEISVQIIYLSFD